MANRKDRRAAAANTRTGSKAGGTPPSPPLREDPPAKDLVKTAPSAPNITTSPSPSSSGQVVVLDKSPQTAAQIVTATRDEMRQEMSDRLKGLMASVRAGVMTEVMALGTDLAEALIGDIVDRLEAIKDTLAKPMSPVMKPVLRRRIEDLKGQLTAHYLQLLGPSGQKDEAAALAAAAVNELVPNFQDEPTK